MTLLKRLLTCFTLILILTCAATGTVFAKPIELTEINAFDLDKDTVRIEISYGGNNQIDAGDISTEIKNGVLNVELKNTLPGRVNRLSGTKIQPGAQDFIEKIFANKDKQQNTTVQIYLRSTVKGGVKVSFEPSNRAEKKLNRIVLDVKATPVQNDWSSFSDTPGTFSGTSGGNKIIVIDPGHGGSDTGAIGPSGLKEKNVSLAVALKAQKLLTAAGYHIVMTRTTDIDVAAPGVPDATELQARVDKSPPNTDIFISIHCNAFSNGHAHGVETYYAPGAVKGERLARLLNEELLRFGGLDNRGTKPARFYVITHSKCPASLIELGFITNPREEKLLASNDYQQKLAQAITNAVNRYFNQGGTD